MSTFRTEDERFDQGRWTTKAAPARFTQRHLDGEPLIFCETVMSVHGSLETAVNLIRGPWQWWRSGRITGYHVNADGSSDQVLSPVWWYTTRINLHILPPGADHLGQHSECVFRST